MAKETVKLLSINEREKILDLVEREEGLSGLRKIQEQIDIFFKSARTKYEFILNRDEYLKTIKVRFTR